MLKEITFSSCASATIVLPNVHLVPVAHLLEVDIVQPSRAVDAPKLDLFTYAWCTHTAMSYSRMSPVRNLETSEAARSEAVIINLQYRFPTHVD